MSVPVPILLPEELLSKMDIGTSEIEKVLGNLLSILPAFLFSELVPSMAHWFETLGNTMDYFPALVYVESLARLSLTLVVKMSPSKFGTSSARCLSNAPS
jgi:hypothetical protein